MICCLFVAPWSFVVPFLLVCCCCLNVLLLLLHCFCLIVDWFSLASSIGTIASLWFVLIIDFFITAFIFGWHLSSCALRHSCFFWLLWVVLYYLLLLCCFLCFLLLGDLLNIVVYAFLFYGWLIDSFIYSLLTFVAYYLHISSWLLLALFCLPLSWFYTLFIMTLYVFLILIAPSILFLALLVLDCFWLALLFFCAIASFLFSDYVLTFVDCYHLLIWTWPFMHVLLTDFWLFMDCLISLYVYWFLHDSSLFLALLLYEFLCAATLLLICECCLYFYTCLVFWICGLRVSFVSQFCAFLDMPCIFRLCFYVIISCVCFWSLLALCYCPLIYCLFISCVLIISCFLFIYCLILASCFLILWCAHCLCFFLVRASLFASCGFLASACFLLCLFIYTFIICYLLFLLGAAAWFLLWLIYWWLVLASLLFSFHFICLVFGDCLTCLSFLALLFY